MSESLHIVCPNCDSINRVPAGRLGEGGNCGKCHNPLFTGASLALDEARFSGHLQRNDIPLTVDFWASWCGPCKMMAPAFEQAARTLEPRARLVKVNTEQAPNLSTQYGIRSIPTLIFFRRGQELDRVSGAMDAGGLANWARRYL